MAAPTPIGMASRETAWKSGTEQEDGATHHHIEQDQQETLEPHQLPILGDLAELTFPRFDRVPKAEIY